MDTNATLNKETLGFLEDLKQRPDVLGVILFGSWARGNNRLDSDVDLIVILEDGFKRTVEYRQNQAFEIIYTTAQSALEFWEHQKDDCAGLWEVAKILYDKDGTIQKLQRDSAQILRAGKPPYDNDQLRQLRFDAEDQLRYVESILDSDPTTANMLLTSKVFMLTELFFDMRQQWAPAPKQRLAKIKTLSDPFYGLLENFYRDGIGINEKLSVVHKMIPIVFNIRQH